MLTITQPLTLEQFLQQPETEPPYEFIQGEIAQKLMPQGEHSRLQSKLCNVINNVTEPPKIALAFSELRCTFGNVSIVPDLAVFRWERIPRTPSGRIANRFEIPPDWCIEIRSPDQRHHQIIEKLLHCVQYGTELGWLIDSEDESILTLSPNQSLQVLRKNALLPVINGINLSLTVADVFQWLNI